MGAVGMRRLAVAQGPAGWTVQERWTSSGLKPYYNDFVVHNGHAFGFDGSLLACIDLADGALIPAIEGKTWNHPVLVRDVVLVRNAEEMAAFRLAVAR